MHASAAAAAVAGHATGAAYPTFWTRAARFRADFFARPCPPQETWRARSLSLSFSLSFSLAPFSSLSRLLLRAEIIIHHVLIVGPLGLWSRLPITIYDYARGTCCRRRGYSRTPEHSCAFTSRTTRRRGQRRSPLRTPRTCRRHSRESRERLKTFIAISRFASSTLLLRVATAILFFVFPFFFAVVVVAR